MFSSNMQFLAVGECDLLKFRHEFLCITFRLALNNEHRFFYFHFGLVLHKRRDFGEAIRCPFATTHVGYPMWLGCRLLCFPRRRLRIIFLNWERCFTEFQA